MSDVDDTTTEGLTEGPNGRERADKAIDEMAADFADASDQELILDGPGVGAADGDGVGATPEVHDAVEVEDFVSLVAAPPDDHARILEMARSWADGAREGVQLLMNREHALRSLELGQSGDMSLVKLQDSVAEFGVEGARVVFVTWMDVHTKVGRIAHVDAKGKSVYSTTFVHMPRCFIHSIIVHPAIGVRNVKEKSSGRPQIPSNMLRLRDMFELATSSAARITTMLPCELCAKGPTDVEPVARCALCLKTWHDSCAARILGLEIVQPTRIDRQLREFPLPVGFVSVEAERKNLCCVCMRCWGPRDSSSSSSH